MAAIFKEKLNETVLLETDTNQVTASIWGDLIEYGNTEKMFEQPRDQRTEDYITGRFG